MGLFDNINFRPGGPGNPFDFLSDTPPAADAAPQGVTPIAPATVMPDAGPGGALPPPNLSGGVLPNLSGQALQGTGLGGAPAADDDAPATPAMLAPQSGFKGLLGRLTSPDPSGITFSDKLNAIGSILQGHSDQADKYMADRRASIVKQQEEAQKLKDAAEKVAEAKQATADLSASYKDGIFHPEIYTQLRAQHQGGIDDKVLSAIYPASVPKIVPVTGKNGEVTLVRENAPPGVDPMVARIAGIPDAGPNQHWLGDPTKGDFRVAVNPGSKADTAVIEADSAARRRGAPLQGRAGPKASAFDPSVITRKNPRT